MDETNIVELTTDGLRYLDDNGKESYIDFAACYQWYLDEWNDPENVRRYKELNSMFTDEELEKHLEVIRAIKEVGKRNFTVPYIEFYSDPPTRFDFSTQNEFYQVEGFIRKIARYHIFDMS